MDRLLKIILIHGNGGGTAHDQWLPYAATELRLFGVEVIARDFPDAVEAKASSWLPFLKDELKADEHTIIIGHSSGAVAAMRFAEKYQLYGSVLVGASYTDLGLESERVSGYFDAPWQWDRIKANQQWVIQFASLDDPYIPIEEARVIHHKLQTDYYEYVDRGHFGSPGHPLFEFPELVEVLEQHLANRSYYPNNN